MNVRNKIPLRHPFLEDIAPGPESPRERAAFFKELGEWPHAVSALMEAGWRGATDGLSESLAEIGENWRSNECDTGAVERLGSLDFKKLLAEIRNRGQAEGTDLERIAFDLREAYLRNPENQVVQHLLSITYLRLLDAGKPAAKDTAYQHYLMVDDVDELAARVDHLVARRRHIPHWLAVCPNSSGTWQLRNYLLHLQQLGLSCFLFETHKFRRERTVPIQRAARAMAWQTFSHLSAHTDMRFVVAGNLHDPVQALTYTLVRKFLRSRLQEKNAGAPIYWATVPDDDADAVCSRVQEILDAHSFIDLAGYFQQNYEHAFGLPIDAYQIRQKNRGYFIGFRDNVTLMLFRLREMETVLPEVLRDVLSVDTSGCRAPSEFRVTSDPALSDHIRKLAKRIRVPRAVAERSINTPFMEAHFLPEQLQEMRDRWYADAECPADG